MASKETPVYRLDVSGTIGARYIPLVEELIRTVVIQVLVQLFLSIVDGDPFFSGSFWLVLIYILLGISTYHLIFRNVVVLV